MAAQVYGWAVNGQKKNKYLRSVRDTDMPVLAFTLYNSVKIHYYMEDTQQQWQKNWS